MKQPNSNDCFVCGIKNPRGLGLEFYSTGPGEVTAEYRVSADYQGYPGVVHGGIVAAMLDEVCGRTLMEGNPPRFMYTARLDIRYRKNVPVGELLRLVGKAGRSRNRSAEASGAIYDQAGEVLAEAKALLVDIPQNILGDVDLEEFGWKVYPDAMESGE